MKIKKLIILGVTVLSTALLAACSSSSIKYTKDGVGTVTIKKYKGVEADMADAAIADDEMKTILENAYETAPSYKTLSKDVENGDTVNIDFEGSINGEKFEGGTAQATDLTIGSGGFIEGFEEQLIGMKAGEEKTITVTFPADYYSQDLAGKEAQFKVKVNEIKEKLNSDEGINDEWVKTFVTAQGLDKGIDSVDKLKEFIISNRKNQYEADAVNTVIDKIMKEAEFDLNQENVNKKIDESVAAQEESLKQYGMDLEQLAQQQNKTVDQYKEELRGQLKETVESGIKAELIYDAIMNTEKLNITDQDYSDMYEKYTGEKGKTKEQLNIEFGEDVAEQAVKSYIISKFLLEKSKFTVKSAEEIEKARQESMSVEAAKTSEASSESESSSEGKASEASSESKAETTAANADEKTSSGN